MKECLSPLRFDIPRVKSGRPGRHASLFGELVPKLAMYITSVLVFLHGPEGRRLAAALFFPSLPDVLLLLLVLDQMLAVVLGEQNARVVKFGEEIGANRADRLGPGGFTECAGRPPSMTRRRA